jgi:hypothetical protein
MRYYYCFTFAGCTMVVIMHQLLIKALVPSGGHMLMLLTQSALPKIR